MTEQANSEMPPGLPDRIRQCARLVGSGDELSRRSEIPRRTLENYLQGRSEPKASALFAIANSAGVSLDWLVAGRLPVHPIERLEEFSAEVGADILAKDGDKVLVAQVKTAAELGGDFVLVPRYDVRAAAGGGAVIHSEQIVDHLAFKADWVRTTLRLNPSWLLLIEAVGDSMEDTISDGDLLLVNTHEPRIKENAIYAISVNGNLLVKRIQLKLDGTLVVKSDNPRYDAEVVPPNEADQLRVIGQVVWHGGLVR